jgi:hypothetical protein
MIIALNGFLLWQTVFRLTVRSSEAVPAKFGGVPSGLVNR